MSSNGASSNGHDTIELQEWRDSLNDVMRISGPDQVRRIIREVDNASQSLGIQREIPLNTPYINTIGPNDEAPFPGSREIERRIKSIVRWNAMAMVVRANKNHKGIGGHISTFASAATLYEIGYNHFFRGRTENHPGDLIYFQGHASPGIYSRAFLEGRLTEQDLTNFRRELAPGGGLSSYPHPWLMPDFWQFPTVSMGLGPISAIYQARFIRYLENRGLKERTDQQVWGFLGDGECDEPETLGCIDVAGREELDNITFVVNCNLQRLDGPVRGNGKIANELEATFRAAGWNVIKVLWASNWDPLIENDHDGHLLSRFNNVVDGALQKYILADGAYVREKFFGTSPELAAMVAHMSDDELTTLKRGGHDPEKVYAAYKAATDHKGQPTVILAQTVKGYGLGEAGEGRNMTHNQKALNQAELREFRTRFGIPISDEDLDDAPFYRPPEDSVEMQYVRERRASLGGHVPARKVQLHVPFSMPKDGIFDEFEKGTGEKEASTTMVWVRLIGKLLKDKAMGKFIVPIVPDESRTFGMDGLFSAVGIYAHDGQKYEPVDSHLLQYYKESKDGQILQEGINEAGAMASFTAAGAAYSNHGLPMVPFYIYYSMFGFQRVGDAIWCAGDTRCKGFLCGGTAGRTTLNGEGLQHEDGHSHLVASTIINCKPYDPAYAFELAIIIEEGLKEMYVEEKEVFYYVTMMNEEYVQPPIPASNAKEKKVIRDGILKGIYKFKAGGGRGNVKANLWGSGTILNEVVKAQEILATKYKVKTDVYSVTSYPLLHRDAQTTRRFNLLNPGKKKKKSIIETMFSDPKQATIASSDYVKYLPDGLSRELPGPYLGLGTDGYGRSESRANLRDFFEVDHRYVVLATLSQLAEIGEVDKKLPAKALKDLKIDPNKLDPLVS